MFKRTSKPWEKSLICRGLTISQEGGPIWKKMSHTYDAKVPKVTVYIWSNRGEIRVIKRIDILEPTIEDNTRNSQDGGYTTYFS